MVKLMLEGHYKKYNVLTEGKTNGSLSKLLKMWMTKMGCI